MRIVHISNDASHSGAGRAALRVHKGLLRRGYDSIMYAARSEGDPEGVVKLCLAQSFGARLRRLLQYLPIKLEKSLQPRREPGGYPKFSPARSQIGHSMVRRLPEGDIYNLHWVADFLDYQKFFRALPPETPVVWRLADMNPYTGGCHYDYGCGRFRAKCGACPQLGAYAVRDLSFRIWRRKKRALSSLTADRLCVVGPSRWAADQARRSSLLGRFRSRIIPNSVDTDLFSPRNVLESRLGEDLPTERPIMLFVAQDLSDRLKGLDLLLESIRQLNRSHDALLVLVGRNSAGIPCAIPHVRLGFVKNDMRLSRIYSAADFLVMPSRQESFGQTALEAISCGTPVIGFDVGGIPDMVRHGDTGFLARPEDTADLARWIDHLLADQTLRQSISARCRQVALTEYNLELQAKRYAGLYEEMLERKPAADGD